MTLTPSEKALSIKVVRYFGKVEMIEKMEVPSPRVIIDGQAYHHDYRKDFTDHPEGSYDGHRREWKTQITAILNR